MTGYRCLPTKKENTMNIEQNSVKDLNLDMEHVINDAEHLLKDLKGQKHLKRLLRKDTRRLKEHLQKLITDVTRMESKHAE
jgi:hypothetical protein